MYRIEKSTVPCHADRKRNPIGKFSKYNFHRLEVGYSVFIPYECDGDFVPYEPGLARINANAMNRKYKGQIELKTSVIRVNDNNFLMEIARIA